MMSHADKEAYEQLPTHLQCTDSAFRRAELREKSLDGTSVSAYYSAKKAYKEWPLWLRRAHDEEIDDGAKYESWFRHNDQSQGTDDPSIAFRSAHRGHLSTPLQGIARAAKAVALAARSSSTNCANTRTYGEAPTDQSNADSAGSIAGSLLEYGDSQSADESGEC